MKTLKEVALKTLIWGLTGVGGKRLECASEKIGGQAPAKIAVRGGKRKKNHFDGVNCKGCITT